MSRGPAYMGDSFSQLYPLLITILNCKTSFFFPQPLSLLMIHNQYLYW